MKSHIAWLTIIRVAVVSLPVWAQYAFYYDNGPINGTTDAWTINFGYIVSDTFVAPDPYLDMFQFGVWEIPGDIMTSVGWSITSGENSGTVYGSGTATKGDSLRDAFISTNQYGYDIDLITVTMYATVTPGTQYWLNLFNATTPSGDPVYWDENSGKGCGGTGTGCPSQASESGVGTIASEAFTIGWVPTPEPSSILLFGSGVLGLAGLLRRKLM